MTYTFETRAKFYGLDEGRTLAPVHWLILGMPRMKQLVCPELWPSGKTISHRRFKTTSWARPMMFSFLPPHIQPITSVCPQFEVPKLLSVSLVHLQGLPCLSCSTTAFWLYPCSCYYHFILLWHSQHSEHCPAILWHLNPCRGSTLFSE